MEHCRGSGREGCAVALLASGLRGGLRDGVRGGLGRFAAGFCCSSALTEWKPARFEIVARIPVGGRPSLCAQ